MYVKFGTPAASTEKFGTPGAGAEYHGVAAEKFGTPGAPEDATIRQRSGLKMRVTLPTAEEEELNTTPSTKSSGGEICRLYCCMYCKAICNMLLRQLC